jgi:type II secretory pathway pseudopilin PulG
MEIIAMVKTLRASVTKLNSQRGDTIIEVVIAMAVLGLVLGASAVLVNRSSKTLQTSQESAVALRGAQKQIEYLRFFADAKPDELPSSDQVFCMKDENSKTINSAECTTLNGGASYIPRIKLIYHDTDGGYYDAHVNVDWETLTGVPGSVELSQRIYKKLGARVPDGGGSCPAGLVLPAPGQPCVPAPSVTLSASPTKILRGESTYLSWQGQKVTSCEASGAWSGTKVTAGGQYVAPTSSSSYTIRCSGIGGQTSHTVTVTVDPPRQALHRCYQFWHGGDYRIHTNHHYSTDRNFCDGNGFGSGSYEGIAGYTPLGSNSGAIPVYSAYSGADSSPAYGDTFYTTSAWEYSSVALPNAHNHAGGVVFYVYPYNNGCSVAGTVPMYRYWSDFVGNHFYTANGSENPNAFAPQDGGGTFVYETILGCIFRNAR